MPMYKKSLLILLLIACVGGGAAMYGYESRDEVLPLDAAERPEAQRSMEITVYVTGAVNQPGIVTVPEEARVADAVNACGGVLPTAALDQVNMAQKLKDGQQVRVPEKSADAAAAAGGAGNQEKGTDASGRVNINLADEKTLDSLPGIGPAMAKRIIDYRNTEGMFQSPEDLKKIKGIGDAKFEKLKDKITV